MILTYLVPVLFTFYINGIYSPFSSLQNAVCFIILMYLVPVLFTFYIHGVYSPFFSLQNAICFIILTYLVPLLFTFCIHGIYSPFFSSSKCSLFHNSNIFGSCIIHIYINGICFFFLFKMQFVS